MGTWLLQVLTTFGAFGRDEEEALVSQLLFVPEFLAAPSAFIVLPLESLCEPFSPCLGLLLLLSSTMQPSSFIASPASLGGTGPLLGPKAGGRKPYVCCPG